MKITIEITEDQAQELKKWARDPSSFYSHRNNPHVTNGIPTAMAILVHDALPLEVNDRVVLLDPPFDDPEHLIIGLHPPYAWVLGREDDTPLTVHTTRLKRA